MNSLENTNQTRKQLILENSEGEVLRVFAWSSAEAHVVRRSDTKRLEIVENLDVLTAQKIKFEDLGQITQAGLAKKPFLVSSLGEIKFVESVEAVQKNVLLDEENQKVWRQSLGAMVLLTVGFMSLLWNQPLMTPKIEEELKLQVVQITKRIPPPVVKMQNQVSQFQNQTQTSKVTTTKPRVDTIKRSGALSALGSLSKSNQKGGLNLGAATVSAGPGLGGTEGSGGAQTSLYAKGITSAPLGAGANMAGAGGYGTKGKGGGQAGYGKLSLVGSTGAAPLPLGHEAVVASGLDRDAISAVIQKNLGQVRFCYEQGLQSDPALSGRVSMGFTIGGNGVVSSAGVENSTLNSKVVEDCLAMRLKSWKFPLPQGGVDVKVSYPFVLRRAGQG